MATKTDLVELVQARISKEAKTKLVKQAEEATLTPAAYIRRLIYRDLGLAKKGA